MAWVSFILCAPLGHFIVTLSLHGPLVYNKKTPTLLTLIILPFLVFTHANIILYIYFNIYIHVSSSIIVFYIPFIAYII